MRLSSEQMQMVAYAQAGHNILVDACIGSGKTTAIQALCDQLPGKRILYLTYNKLLKLDARDRIRNRNVLVTNYHGFAYMELKRAGISCGLFELIQTYLTRRPPVSQYDVLVLDEYQDIDLEISRMLELIKEQLPNLQIVAVGDMDQKIYDKTTLDVHSFIHKFLGNYIPMEFTWCFRLGSSHAAMLGRIWGKSIVGKNPDFEIRILPSYQIQHLAAECKPGDLLVLGSKAGHANNLQNYLEKNHKDRFNKRTLWSKIKDTEGATSPTPDCAIFTTYDGSKGMERDVCILYDWTKSYWEARVQKPAQNVDILRNIFCVAASRAKKLLIIEDAGDQMEEYDLIHAHGSYNAWSDMTPSTMFDFKFVEDVEEAYHELKITEIMPPGDIISIPLSDELIDLSMCIGSWQEAEYFTKYDIDAEIEFELKDPKKSFMAKNYKNYSLDKKLLYLAALQTKQFRYMNQVRALPISEENRRAVRNRLHKLFPEDAIVQQPCSMVVATKGYGESIAVDGILDVYMDEIVYELKFVQSLSHVHALQLAMYLIMTDKEVGRLYNTRNNQMLEIRIPDRKRFLEKAIKAATKSQWTGNFTTMLEPFEVQ